MPEFFFFYHAIVITALSLLVVTRENPVHSVLFMLVLFFHIASLYLFLDAEFMAAVQIIVYAGAILVLFLFVVFLLNLRKEELSRKYIGSWPTGFVVGAGIFAVLALTLVHVTPGPSSTFSISYIEKVTNTRAVGTRLYTDYLFPFEVASVVLLVAIVGSITLAKKRLKS
ncbi:MAG: NADH-quinone oxidoreductase subunit J [Nitrospirota bacterium]